MQKKLIALAVAGLVSAPAFAQSNVTVYGILDMSVQSREENGQDRHGFVNDNAWSSSRLGFKGTEDLGNGLKAIFQIEMGTLDLDGGGAVNTGRDTFVGLSGGFGTIRAGRYLSPIGAWGGDYEATGGSNDFRVDQNFGEGLRKTFDDRFANSVSYATPTMGGFSGVLTYAPDENAATRKDYAFGGLRYDNGPIKVGYTYQRQNQMASFQSLGASYDFGVVALKAQYSIGDDFTEKQGDDERSWSLGVVAPVGAAGKVSLAYGKATDLGGTAEGAAARDADIWAVTYMHGLSKRTALYAGYSDRDFDKTDTGDRSIFALGLRHIF